VPFDQNAHSANAAHAGSLVTVCSAAHGSLLIASEHARKSLTARSAHFDHVASPVHADWLVFDFTVVPPEHVFDLP
jgi:hypothetical protein